MKKMMMLGGSFLMAIGIAGVAVAQSGGSSVSRTAADVVVPRTLEPRTGSGISDSAAMGEGESYPPGEGIELPPAPGIPLPSICEIDPAACEDEGGVGDGPGAGNGGVPIHVPGWDWPVYVKCHFTLEPTFPQYPSTDPLGNTEEAVVEAIDGGFRCSQGGMYVDNGWESMNMGGGYGARVSVNLEISGVPDGVEYNRYRGDSGYIFFGNQRGWCSNEGMVVRCGPERIWNLTWNIKINPNQVHHDPIESSGNFEFTDQKKLRMDIHYDVCGVADAIPCRR